MYRIADALIPNLNWTSTGSLNTRPGGTNETALRLGSADNIQLAAEWTPTEDFVHVKEVWLLLKKTGTITSGKVLTVAIQSDNGSGLPSGTALGTSANVETDTISATAAQWVKFTFSNHVQGIGGTKYHFVLSGNYDVSSSNYIAWISDTVSSGGNSEIKDADWSNDATKDFNIYAKQYNLLAHGLAEPILYAGTEYPAIYDAPGSMIIIGDTEVQSQDPSIEIRQSDVASPARNDAIKVRGTTFYAQDIYPDGDGTTRIMLSQDQST